MMDDDNIHQTHFAGLICNYVGLMLHYTLEHGQRTNLFCDHWYQLGKLGHLSGIDLCTGPRDHIVCT
jgi:hypothetical protein